MFPNIKIPNLPKLPSIHDFGKGSTKSLVELEGGTNARTDRDVGIDRMVAKLTEDPLMVPARYLVMFTPGNKVLARTPPAMRDSIFNNGSLFLGCSSVQIPGRSFATNEHAHWGPNIKIPYQEIFDAVSFVFYLSESMKERNFFDYWFDAVGSRDYREGGIEGEYNNKLAYYNDFIGQCSIFPLSRDGRRMAHYKIINLYPTAMNNSIFGYNMGTSWAEISIAFGIDRYEQVKSFVPDPAPVQSLFSQIYNVGAKIADIPADFLPSVNPFGGR